MGYDFEASSSQYAEVSAVAVATHPLTIAGWGKLESTGTGNMVLCNIVTTTTEIDYYALEYRDDTGKVGAVDRSSAGDAVRAESTAGPGTAAWRHFSARFNSLSSRDGFYEGANKGSNSTANELPGIATALNRMGVGRLGRNTPVDYFDGLIAEVGIWNVALSDANIASLAAGASPAEIQSANLVAFWRFKTNEGSTITDESANNNHLTVTGAVWSADHPTVNDPPALPAKTGTASLGFTATGTQTVPKFGVGRSALGFSASALRNSTYGETGTGRMGSTAYGAKGGIIHTKQNGSKATIKLVWDASPDATVTGYTLYWAVGTPGPPYPNTTGNLGLVTTKRLNTMDRGNYEFVVTATNPAGESAPSNEVPATLSYGVMFSEKGAKLHEFLRQETARVVFVGSGASVFISATGKTGGAAVGFSGSGADAMFSAEAAAGVMGFTATGADVASYAETGTVRTEFIVSGASFIGGPGLFLKAGLGAMGFTSDGALASVFAERGTGYLGHSASGLSTKISIPTTVGVVKIRKMSEGRSKILSLTEDR